MPFARKCHMPWPVQPCTQCACTHREQLQCWGTHREQLQCWGTHSEQLRQLPSAAERCKATYVFMLGEPCTHTGCDTHTHTHTHTPGVPRTCAGCALKTTARTHAGYATPSQPTRSPPGHRGLPHTRAASSRVWQVPLLWLFSSTHAIQAMHDQASRHSMTQDPPLPPALDHATFYALSIAHSSIQQHLPLPGGQICRPTKMAWMEHCPWGSMHGPCSQSCQ